MSKEKVNPVELRQIRLEIAFGICIKFPKLFGKLYSDKHFIMTETESDASEVVNALCKLEPTLKTVLALYFK
jgi:hypothetical protein